ncbi:MAG: histidine kinase [Bacteroidetes bacterium]|nr:histidine kinase [Bacteroidota bacterium]
MAVKLFQTWIINTEHITELRQQNLQSELTQLKSQINPHFLFNTLNNINTLTQTNPTKASEVIIKLSDLLRYQLYDSTQDKISLKSDIIFLENFLNIEKMRRDNFSFSVNVSGDTHTIQIPPFMFIPFIENATKHSVNPLNSSYIKVNFKIEKDTLVFECENSVAHSKNTNLEPGGIGLANIKRRLELLFEGKHILIITQQTDMYYAKLTLNL